MTALPTVRRRTSILGAVIVAALSTTFAVAPAQALAEGPPVTPANSKVAYVALGDSYAAGFGGGDYTPGDLCFTSPNGYAALLAEDPGQVHTDLRGCTGATTGVVMATQLEGLDHRTKSVTLTVGANDLGVGAVGQACLPPTGAPESVACSLALAHATDPATIAAFMASLASTLTAVREAAPKATVYVTGYPLLFEILGPSDPYSALKVAVNDAVSDLNDLIEYAAAVAGPGFVYVDVETAFAGHGIGSATPWIVAPPDLAAFHPNAAGYMAYAAAIRAAGFWPAD